MNIYLVGRPRIDLVALHSFLVEHTKNGCASEFEKTNHAQSLCMIAGKLCYMSFGKGRDAVSFFENILASKHGSILEHAVWQFIITGVSRSLTHELVRHRVGFSYSQLSQRYVDSSEVEFIKPRLIEDDAELSKDFDNLTAIAKSFYKHAAEKLQGNDVGTARRKIARQTARSLLPNATETKIFVTANARALRHFFELRGNLHADTEIYNLAMKWHCVMVNEAPLLFGDYEEVDGNLTTKNGKV